jgi:hypothetical protein
MLDENLASSRQKSLEKLDVMGCLESKAAVLVQPKPASSSSPPASLSSSNGSNEKEAVKVLLKHVELVDESHIALRRGSLSKILPEVGFVLKARRSNNSKVFINVFYSVKVHRIVPIPKSVSRDKQGESADVYGVVLPHGKFIKSVDGEAKDTVVVKF